MSEPTWPRLKLGSHLVPGLAAVALFAVLAVVVLGGDFGAAEGFPTDAGITASIGYAMFNLSFGDVPSEGFLVAFLTIAVVLDAALDGAVMLAKREDDEAGAITALTDGGRVREALGGDDATEGGDGAEAGDGAADDDATDGGDH